MTPMVPLVACTVAKFLRSEGVSVLHNAKPH
jgi:hypothetical protein